MNPVIVIGDGMADLPVKKLGGKTPLEIAKKPNMDYIAKRGLTGLLTLTGGVNPGSTVEALADLLGFDPHTARLYRALFEAFGLEMKVKPGDLVFRCNLAKAIKGKLVASRVRLRNSGKRDFIEKSANEVLREIAGLYGVCGEVKLGTDFRCTILLRGLNLGSNILLPDPLTPSSPLAVKPLHRNSKVTASILNSFINTLERELEEEEVNVIVPWCFSTYDDKFKLTFRGKLKGACVAAVEVVKGFCKCLGFKAVSVKGATGYVDTDYIAKAKAAAKEASKLPVLLHFEAPDEASHEKSLSLKLEAIRGVDNAVGTLIDEGCETIVLMADHATSVETGLHVRTPVPAAFTGLDLKPDNVNFFSENTTRKGCLTGRFIRDLGRIAGFATN